MSQLNSGDPRLGLNASDYFKTGGEVKKVTDLMSTAMNAFAQQCKSSGIASSGFVVKLNEVDAQGRKVSVTMQQVDGVFQIVNKTIGTSIGLFDKQKQAAKALADAFKQNEAATNAYHESVRKADRAVAGFMRRGLEHQAKLQADALAEADRIFNEYERSVRRADRAVAGFMRRGLAEKLKLERQALIEASNAFNEYQSRVRTADTAVRGFQQRGEQYRRSQVLAEQQRLFDRLAKDAREADKAYNQYQASVRRADAAVAGFARRGEEERRAKLLAEQQRLYDHLADSARRMAQHEKERRDRLTEQLALSKQLQSVRESALRQERIQRAAEGAGTRLRNQFASQSSGSWMVATPDERNKVLSSIGQVQSAIARGAISASRALQVIRQAQAGTAGVLTGTEAKIASLGLRIQSASGNLGAAFRKNFSTVQATLAQNNANMNRSARVSEQAAQRILISWRDLGRIFAIQALHTVIGRFIIALREGVQTASQFQIRISEIRTISQDNQQTFDRWASSVRALSDQFGNPILDVAEGMYETISNQIARGAETAQFMGKALQFAATTVSSTADSVNLLSSVMNAYKLNITDVDRISAQLFRTIDLGRVRAQDIANEFGRVLPVAANLGISFEELSAALATITIQGVTPSETLTSIFGILNKLLKPTGEMKNFLGELGFASGEAAIAALGFEGVLVKVAEAAEKGDARLGELFNEIRATRGITALVRSLDTYKNTLNSIRTDSLDKFIEAQKIVTESSGKQFTIEMNRIKNIFASDFGGPFIESIVSIGRETDAAGNRISGFSDTVRSGIGVLSGLVKIFLVYKGAVLLSTAATFAHTIQMNLAAASAFAASRGMGAAGAATLVLNSRLRLLRVTNLSTMFSSMQGLSRGLSAAAIPLTALIGGFILLKQAQQDTADAAARNFEENTAKHGEMVARQTVQLTVELRKQQNILQRALEDRLRIEFSATAKVQQVFFKLSEAQEKRAAETARRMKDSLDIAFEGAQEGLRKIEEQGRQATKNIDDAKKALFEQQQGLQSGRFERQNRLLPPKEQIQETFKEIERLQTIASRKLTAPTSDANIAQRNLEETNKLRAQADQLTNNLLEKQVDLVQKRKELEERISDERRKQSQAASIRNEQDLLNAEKDNFKGQGLLDERRGAQDANSGERLADLEAELQIIIDQQGVLGSQVDLEKMISDEIRRRTVSLHDYEKQQDAIKAKAELAAKAERERVEFLRTGFQNLANLAKLPEKIDSAAQARKIRGDFDAQVVELQGAGLTDQAAMQRIAEQRAELFQRVEALVQKNALDANSERLRLEKEQFLKHVEELNKEQEKLNAQAPGGVQTIKNIAQAVKDFAPSQTIATQLLGRFAAEDSTFRRVTGTKAIEDSLESLAKEINSLRQGTGGTAKGARAFMETIVSELLARAGETDPSKVIIKDSADPEQRLTVAKLQDQFERALTEIISAPKAQKALDQARKEVEDAVKARGLDLATAEASLAQKSTTQAANDLATAIRNSSKAMGDLITSTQTAAAALQALGNKPQPLPAKPFAKGGYAQIQWIPRGMDTIPAMLSPGEYVVRAEAAKRHRKLLESINRPQYYARGGEVSHVVSSRSFDFGNLAMGGVSIGDIIVNGVPISGDVRVDARALANEIHRNIRLGVTKPFKQET